MTEYYKEKLEAGNKYQDFICDILRKKCGIFVGVYTSKEYQRNKGESQAGIEIKHDMKMAETGNVFIETAEKSDPQNPNWVPSGVYRKDNTWLYVIGDYHDIYFFSKQQLRNLIESEKRRKAHKMQYKEIRKQTAQGYTYPIEMALKTGSCLKHIVIEEGDRQDA